MFNCRQGGGLPCRQKVVVNLAVALLLADLLFVRLVENEKDVSSTFCSIIATLIHYFTLEAFAWMMIYTVITTWPRLETFWLQEQGRLGSWERQQHQLWVSCRCYVTCVYFCDKTGSNLYFLKNVYNTAHVFLVGIYFGILMTALQNNSLIKVQYKDRKSVV